ncbi:putative uncharacterized protein [Clostridium sp. CAG:1219]|nr:putative uncharacterized protein [Clostridium sp. CAG:1219]
MACEVVLKIKDLTKVYNKKRVVDGLTLNVEAGQIYGFLGPNGAGKTTTIKMITGLIKKDAGDIVINGIDAVKNHDVAMNYVGAIVEVPSFYEYMSGMENLRLYARLRNIKKEQILKIVKLVKLENKINEKVKKYSLGMKQRLGLAVSLLHSPKLLILDEPTNGLDPEGIRELRELLKKIAHEDNVAVFVSSHLLSEMQLMCDKVAIINNGKIVKVESMDSIKNESNIYEFNVSDIDMAQKYIGKIARCEKKQNKLIVFYDGKISDILKLLMENGIEVVSFEKKVNMLEEKFLSMTGGKI